MAATNGPSPKIHIHIPQIHIRISTRAYHMRVRHAHTYRYACMNEHTALNKLSEKFLASGVSSCTFR